MTILLAIFGVVLAVCALILIRNEMVYKYNARAIDYIFSQPNWGELREKYDPAGNYNRNMFDLRKWTYKQMFPGL